MFKSIVKSVSVLLLFAISLAAQTGGTYDLSHAVIASGGATVSAANNYQIGGTIGQSIAGGESQSGAFQLRGGFWAWEALAPTAATVTVSGRVMTAHGYGIRSATVTLTEPNGTRRTATTATFGYFTFDGVLAGQTYIVEVFSGRHSFAEPSRVVSVVDEVSGLDFVAHSQ